MSKKLKPSIPFKLQSEFREADKIITYLENPDGEHQITKQLQQKLDRYIAVHALKLRYKTNSFIVGILGETHNRNKRQAMYDIQETEYIFGKVVKINHAFETAFLLEASRKNIELAFITRDNNKISKSLEAHKKIIGDKKDESQLPDFSKFEQHIYNIVIPIQIQNMLLQLSGAGAINLSDFIPSQQLESVMDKIIEDKNTEDIEHEE